jgi:hypothetical protein
MIANSFVLQLAPQNNKTNARINRLQHWQKVGRGGMIKSRIALMRIDCFRIVTLAQCSNFDLASQKADQYSANLARADFTLIGIIDPKSWMPQNCGEHKRRYQNE